MHIRSETGRSWLRGAAIATACALFAAGGAAHTTPGTFAAPNGIETASAGVQMAQNSRQQPRNPNSGNQNPPNSGNARPGRPQGPDRLCSEVRNPRPGQNCTERGEHFRPAQRPPE